MNFLPPVESKKDLNFRYSMHRHFAIPRVYKSRFLQIGLILFLAVSNQLMAQSIDLSWKQSLPDGRLWKCEIQNHKLPAYQADHAVTITHQETSIHISDFTGNFFKQYADSSVFEKAVQLDGNLVVPETFITAYGPCEISGSWNAPTQTLTLNWKIPYNAINEISVFMLTEN